LRRRNLAGSLKLAGTAVILLGLTGYSSPQAGSLAQRRTVRVAGVQMEFPNASEIAPALDKLLSTEPGAELLVLSEYTLDGPVPDPVIEWCRQQRRYLIIGGKDPAPNGNFYDTAFVIGPNGDIVFRQVKSIPIQFFKDGLPASEQKLWDSPWGKIGLCVCYDLSYTRVTDRLIRLGAEAIIVPTMDVVEWGRREHELHARVAPIRAAEYGVPIVRVASSGISQIVDSSGHVTASASFPGENETLVGDLTLANSGSLPLDRWLGPFASGLTGIVVISFFVRRRKAFAT
jgi:apolipoprotein N-acyltransferase